VSILNKQMSVSVVGKTAILGLLSMGGKFKKGRLSNTIPVSKILSMQRVCRVANFKLNSKKKVLADQK
jgi:hypothetical protein